MSFKLYQEGKYLITAYDARANDEDSAIFYSGTVAAPYLELTVGDATQPDAVRADLKAALDKVYNAYPKKIFGDDTWADIESAYKAAVATLNDSTATTGEAYLAQQAAIRTIQSKQTETIQANKTALETFRTNLNKLPDDVNKITASESVKEAATTLIQCYTSMNIESIWNTPEKTGIRNRPISLQPSHCQKRNDGMAARSTPRNEKSISCNFALAITATDLMASANSPR